MGKKGDKATPAGNEVAEKLIEQLSTITGVTSKKMFGGFGIFCDKKMFGMITAKGGMYLKADDSNRVDFEEKGSTKHHRMPYYSIPDDILNNQDLLIEWAGKAIGVALKKK